MRVSGGDARGIKLKVPKGARPASEKVRLAIFSSLASRVLDARVLDLYCGSGAYGIEALSRGARHAIFVDDDLGAIGVCRDNVRAAGLAANATIRRSRVERYVERSTDDPFDLVFADPPYPDGRLDLGLLDALVPLVAPDGRVVWETRRRKTPVEAPEGWVLEADRRYGDTQLLVFTRGSGDLS